MKACVIHVDDESEEPRRISESLLYDGIPEVYGESITEGHFEGDMEESRVTKISWSTEQNDFHIHYYSCINEHQISDIKIEDFTSILFIFDVHRDGQFGDGRLLSESVAAAKVLLGEQPLNCIVWTNYPNSPIIEELALKSFVRTKKEISSFALEVMSMLGFRNNE